MSHQVIYFEQMTRPSKPKVPSGLSNGLTLTNTGLENTPPRYDQNTSQHTNIKRSYPNTPQPKKRHKSQ